MTFFGKAFGDFFNKLVTVVCYLREKEYSLQKEAGETRTGVEHRIGKAKITGHIVYKSYWMQLWVCAKLASYG